MDRFGPRSPFAALCRGARRRRGAASGPNARPSPALVAAEAGARGALGRWARGGACSCRARFAHCQGSPLAGLMVEAASGCLGVGPFLGHVSDVHFTPMWAMMLAEERAL